MKLYVLWWKYSAQPPPPPLRSLWALRPYIVRTTALPIPVVGHWREWEKLNEGLTMSWRLAPPPHKKTHKPTLPKKPLNTPPPKKKERHPHMNFFIVCVSVCVCVNQRSHLNNRSQCSTTGVTKAVVCSILSVGWCI